MSGKRAARPTERGDDADRASRTAPGRSGSGPERTEADSGSRPRPVFGARARPVFGARARIVGWSVLLVAVALAVSVLISAQVLLVRADDRATAQLAHEGDKLRAFSTRAVDPRSGQPFGTVDDLLTSFLTDNLPEPVETLFTVIDGHPSRRSPQPPLARLDTDPAIVAFAAAATDPESRSFETPAGTARIAVFPVRMEADPTPAALVVAEFVAPERAEVWSTVRLLAIIGAIALAIAGAGAWLIAGRVLRPIRQVRVTAERISESDLTARIAVAGADDVAALARTFNRMLDRLERAFAAQRQFLNDAGHELRTPLTILRGHLEVMGAGTLDEERTVPLLLDEIDRMRRLVDDLTLLARSDRPDFLRRTETDIADVVADTIAKASALAPRRWQIDNVIDAYVYVDGQRLTQALMQLCANAVAHTQEGDSISAGVDSAAGRLRLWVRDSGSGVAPQDAERIFRRFERGAASLPGHGSGLGLAIVASIAHAHGGGVHVESLPGAGATFIIDLPVPGEPVTSGAADRVSMVGKE